MREIGTDGRGQRARFSSRTGFAREPGAPLEMAGDVLHEEALFRVRGRFVDHEMPCLAFAVEEKARMRVARDRLAALGVATGPWLRELKQAILAGAPADTPIRCAGATGRAGTRSREASASCAPCVLDVAPGRRIGYVTDLRYTEANGARWRRCSHGVDQLFIESVFLDADRAHAQRKNHLTAGQAGGIAREAGARAVVPFHFSPRYGGRAAEIAGRGAGRLVGRGCHVKPRQSAMNPCR